MLLEKAWALVALTKPRALLMIVFTTCLAFMIALTEPVRWLSLLHTALGVLIAAAGSLALNQYMERGLDSKMARTRSRPLPSGRLAPLTALILGVLFMSGGYLYLWLLVNPACSIATMACGASYLLLYTPLKARSSFSSFVGAVPGGLLPVMGWVAARGRLEIGAWVLFVILFLWQIPHALIISIRHREDYAGAGMKQLPLVSDQWTSHRQIVLNVLVLIPVSILPTFLNMTEFVYPFVALLLGFFLLAQAIVYVMRVTDAAAKRVFISLTAYLPLLLLAMYLDKPA